MATREVTNDNAREMLENILGTQEFAQYGLLERLKNLIARLFEKLSFNVPNMDSAAFGAEVIVFLAGLVLMVYLIFKTAPFLNIIVKDVKSEDIIGSGDVQATPAAFIVEADKKALKGDFRGALRDMYIAVLMELDHRRLIAYAKSKTNSDYLQEISQKAAGKETSFRTLVNLFEYKWYGLDGCSKEDFQRGRELYTLLLQEGSYE